MGNLPPHRRSAAIFTEVKPHPVRLADSELLRQTSRDVSRFSAELLPADAVVAKETVNAADKRRREDENDVGHAPFESVAAPLFTGSAFD
jgi:hypothetical protein